MVGVIDQYAVVRGIERVLSLYIDLAQFGLVTVSAVIECGVVDVDEGGGQVNDRQRIAVLELRGPDVLDGLEREREKPLAAEHRRGQDMGDGRFPVAEHELRSVLRAPEVVATVECVIFEGVDILHRDGHEVRARLEGIRSDGLGIVMDGILLLCAGGRVFQQPLAIGSVEHTLVIAVFLRSLLHFYVRQLFRSAERLCLDVNDRFRKGDRHQGIGFKLISVYLYDRVFLPGVLVPDGPGNLRALEAVGLLGVDVQEHHGHFLFRNDLEDHGVLLVHDVFVLGILIGGDGHYLCGKGHQQKYGHDPSFHVNPDSYCVIINY